MIKVRNGIIKPIAYFFVLSMIISMQACVSRYKPLKTIRPLSGDCEDYILFSDSLTKQRDQGFSKRATINISGFSVGSQTNKELLYKEYKPIIETIYANYLLSVSAVKVFAKVQCEHDMEKNWDILAKGQYKQAADVIRACRRHNETDENMEKCLISSMQGKSFKQPLEPPEHN